MIELGYTDKLIGVMLPEPRKKRMARGGYCLLWPEEVVKAGLEDPRIKRVLEQRKRRSDAAVEAAERRRTKTLEKVNEIINNMEKPPRLPLIEIREKALQSKEMKKSENIENIYSVNDADEKTITRWMVNYIRHELTDYNLEVEVADMQNTVGRLDAFLAYEEAVYSNIASVYPELKDECERQFAEKREKRIATQMRY